MKKLGKAIDQQDKQIYELIDEPLILELYPEKQFIYFQI